MTVWQCDLLVPWGCPETTHMEGTDGIRVLYKTYYVHIMYPIMFKAILRDVMGEEKFYFFRFFSSYNYVMTLVVTVISPQCIRAGYFA